MKRPDVVLRNKSKRQRDFVAAAWADPEKRQVRAKKISLKLMGNHNGPVFKKGVKHPKEWAEASSRFMKGRYVGDKHPTWTGAFPEYHALHAWLLHHKTKPNTCQFCGQEKKVDWANTNFQYERKVDDYIALCHSCHVTLDRQVLRITKLYLNYLLVPP